MGQADIRTGVSGYYFTVDEGIKHVRDYCPIFADCLTTTSIFYNSTGTVNLTVSRPYSSDTWTSNVTLPYYQSGARIAAVKCGTKPQFQEIAQLEITGTYIVERSDYGMSFRRQDHLDFKGFSSDYFKDRVSPEKILVVLAGAGGAGGPNFSSGFWSGNGGGGGTVASVILNLTKTGGHYEIYIGKGGNQYSNQDGEPTTINWVSDSGISTTIITVPGGTHGTHLVAGEGGGALTYSPSFRNNGYFYFVSDNYWTRGGDGGNNGNNGESIASFVAYATNRQSDRIGINKLTTSGGSGGSHDTATSGGGGGASAVANGGAVGSSSSPAGEPGATGGGGGGGGRWIYQVAISGGDGGDGKVWIYY